MFRTSRKVTEILKPLIAFGTALVLAMSMLLLGCANSSAPASDTATGDNAERVQLRIGTMITEDFLPMWVAEAEGLFGQGVQVELITFQSAQEMTTAFAAGEIDMAMTDAMVAAKLDQAGSKVSLQWVTLGATAEQGRFGIMTSPNSGITSLKDLAGNPIGVGSNTILEYVMDELMLEAGVLADQIIKEEIPKIPVRYEMMSSNQVAASALPGSLLNLGERSGMVLVADDTKGRNLSQSMMVVRRDVMDDASKSAALGLVREAWDSAAANINDSLESDPGKYRSLLVEKASLPELIAADYPISTYPLAEMPTAEMVDPILVWMFGKGYLETELSFDVTTGGFVEK